MTLDFSLSDEQEQFRQAARDAFMPIHERLADVLASERPAAAFDSVWTALAECGFLGANIPKNMAATAAACWRRS